MKQHQGFTLIELVIVIIILGILAVTAAPKFINFQGDARVSALKGVEGTLKSANSMIYSKALLAGRENLASSVSPAPSIDIGTGTNAVTNFGYLQATLAELENGTDLKFNVGTSATDPTLASGGDNNADWTIFEGSGVVTIWQRGAPATCRITYTQAASTSVAPKYGPLPEASDC
ncbi:prepilin-type N-terminal cleavage/methylation domain-containing protein [Parashewanella curva]|uniref:Prepilin-type N-terminal cleavage/methylation domain-containing protein n=1 Tax=Parashewanella curva TaxID=2338552 RepID=A0A3L8PUF9_9GAMM|nr:prepilin-type N-terminal cleavage/methylation domain-containing protein [Parashewanella curva]RLV59041.1 prepilin-type N-terminal cleavage/methylation domain-containing protein [Parashewanella curva]